MASRREARRGAPRGARSSQDARARAEEWGDHGDDDITEIKTSILKQMQRDHVNLEKRVRDLEKQQRPTSSVVVSKDTLVAFRLYLKSTDTVDSEDLLGRYKRLFTFMGHTDAANALVSATRLKDATGKVYKSALTKLRFNDEEMAAKIVTAKSEYKVGSQRDQKKRAMLIQIKKLDSDGRDLDFGFYEERTYVPKPKAAKVVKPEELDVI